MGSKEAKHKTLVEKKIENILKEYGEYIAEHNKHKGYVDILGIAKAMGFVVVNAITSEDSDGFIAINEKENEILGIRTSRLIGVNSRRSLKWKRFIIAHEIAHYILHYLDHAVELGEMYARREHTKGKNADEQDADYFAACLLMPKELFSKKYKEYTNDLTDNEKSLFLSNDFIVTPAMVLRRIDELGLKIHE